MTHSLCRAAALVLLSAPLAAQGTAWVVDDDGGAEVDFTGLQEAIDAAAEGDTLLVRPGSYTAPPAFPPQPLTIAGKSLTIVGDAGRPVVATNLVVSGLGASQTLVLRGLDFVDTGLEATSCAGVLWIEDADFSGQNFSSTPVPIALDDCAAVHLNRVSAEGIRQIPSSYPALVATDSSVHLYDCALVGGDGYVIISDGAPAASVSGGYLFASGTSFDGGDSGCGGSGIVLFGASPLAELLDCTPTAGTPASCSGSPFGQPVLATTGTAIVLPDSARSFSVDAPVRAGQSTTLAFAGEPLDLVFLDFSLAPGSLVAPALSGVLQPSVVGLRVRFLGVLPASGQLLVPVTIQPLGVPVVTLSMQGAFFTQGGTFVLSGGSELVLLDA